MRRYLYPVSASKTLGTAYLSIFMKKIDLFSFLFPGVMPYPGLTGMEVVDFLKSGQRLKQPDGCPDEL